MPRVGTKGPDGIVKHWGEGGGGDGGRGRPVHQPRTEAQEILVEMFREMLQGAMLKAICRGCIWLGATTLLFAKVSHLPHGFEPSKRPPGMYILLLLPRPRLHK